VLRALVPDLRTPFLLDSDRSTIRASWAVQAVSDSIGEEKNMFESLEERIEQDEKKDVSGRDRALHYLAISAISVVVVGGLAVAIQYVK
jgi:hypothetical protein